MKPQTTTATTATTANPQDSRRRPAQAAHLTIREAQAELGASYDFIWTELTKGNLRGMKLGRVWRISRADLAAYIAERTTAA